VRKPFLIDVLVQLQFAKKNRQAERMAAAPLRPSNVPACPAKPQIVVAFDAQFEQFIEGRFAAVAPA